MEQLGIITTIILKILNSLPDFKFLRTVKINSIKSKINNEIKNLGKMIELKFDPEKNNANFKLELNAENGRKDLISVEIIKYHIEQDKSKNEFVIDEIKISKEWLNVLAEQYLIGKKIFSVNNDQLKLINGLFGK